MSDDFTKGWITRLLYRRARRELRNAKAENRTPRRFWLVDQFGGRRWVCKEIVRWWRDAEKDLAETLGHKDFVLQVVVAECDFFSGAWSWSPLYIDLRTEEGKGRVQDGMILYTELEPGSLAAEAMGPDGIDSMGTLFGVMEFFASRIRAHGLKPDSPEGKRHLFAATQYVAAGNDPDYYHWLQCEKCQRVFVLLADERLVQFFLENQDWSHVEGKGLLCQDCGGLACEHVSDEIPEKWPGRSPEATRLYERVLKWDYQAVQARAEARQRAADKEKYETRCAEHLPALLKESKEGSDRAFCALCRYAEQHISDARDFLPVFMEGLSDPNREDEAAGALAGFGPEAAGAVPILIVALQNDLKQLQEKRSWNAEPFLAALVAIGEPARQAAPVVLHRWRSGILSSSEELLVARFLAAAPGHADTAKTILRGLATQGNNVGTREAAQKELDKIDRP